MKNFNILVSGRSKSGGKIRKPLRASQLPREEMEDTEATEDHFATEIVSKQPEKEEEEDMRELTKLNFPNELNGWRTAVVFLNLVVCVLFFMQVSLIFLEIKRRGKGGSHPQLPLSYREWFFFCYGRSKQRRTQSCKPMALRSGLVV